MRMVVAYEKIAGVVLIACGFLSLCIALSIDSDLGVIFGLKVFGIIAGLIYMVGLGIYLLVRDSI